MQIIGKNQDIQRAMETAFEIAVRDIFKSWEKGLKFHADSSQQKADEA